MIITLTTDFGYHDNFVGVMKGVILNICPQISIVDICHNVPPQDVFKANWIVSSMTPYFPKNTLHIIVVDPGVGSKRRILYVFADGHHFLAPDNGVLSSLPLKSIEVVREVTNKKFFLNNVSNTFHGRDIFASVAGHIANGVEPKSMGLSFACENMKRLHLPEAKIDSVNKKVYGSVIYIDHFGNIITNIPKIALSKVAQSQKMRIYICNTLIDQVVTSYSDSLPNTYLALFNSDMLLEIAKNLGNAAIDLDAKVGMDIVIEY